MNQKLEDIDEAIEWLEEIIEEDGTEVGESLQHLIHINNYSYCFSEEFNKEVEKEILKLAKFYDENFEMVEVEEIIAAVPERVVKTKQLVEKE